jgi:hypothetical protein
MQLRHSARALSNRRSVGGVPFGWLSIQLSASEVLLRAAMAGTAYPTAALRIGATARACAKRLPAGVRNPALLRCDDDEPANMSESIRCDKDVDEQDLLILVCIIERCLLPGALAPVRR